MQVLFGRAVTSEHSVNERLHFPAVPWSIVALPSMVRVLGKIHWQTWCTFLFGGGGGGDLSPCTDLVALRPANLVGPL
jgi:hypothetical protein